MIDSCFISIKPWFASLQDALFPNKCLGCGELFQRERVRQSDAVDLSQSLSLYFCESCRRKWTAVSSPLCRRCGVPFKSREGEDHFCGRCIENNGAFTMARAVGVYDQSLRTAIQTLKFKAGVQLAKPLGRMLHQTFQRYWSPGKIDLIAPIPLHRRRFRQRGFNQAYLLIARWPGAGGEKIVRDLLVRQRATPPQTGLDRRQRRINIRNAFAVRRPGQSAGKRVLLVDDVLTTGATAEACAKVLLKDGASRVDVLTLARAL